MESKFAFLVSVVSSDGDRLQLQKYAISIDPNDYETSTDDAERFCREPEYQEFWLKLLPKGVHFPGNEVVAVESITDVSIIFSRQNQVA